MGKRHHGKGEANSASASRGCDSAAVDAGVAGVAAAHDGAACDDAHAAEATGAVGLAGAASAASTDAVRSVDAASAAHAAAQSSDAPFFSVVLPAYGSEPYLAAALGDLKDQIFTDWEAIVVNDCSPDGSLAIAQQFAAADARIRVVSHEVNRGLSAARNTGLAAARGRYVWFPDPDDRYDFTFLQSVFNSLQQHEAPVVMVGHVEEFYDANGKVERVQEFTFSQESAHLGKTKLRKHVMEFEKGTHYGYAWNKVYERSYLQQGGFTFTEDLPLIEDIEFNIRVFQDLPGLNVVGAPLYRYAKREAGNLTSKFVPRYYEVHRTRIEMLRNQLDSWGLLEDNAKATLGALYARYILSALERNKQKESGMSGSAQKEWLQGVFADELFDELVFCAQADSQALRLCLKPLQQRNASKCLALGGAIHAAKNGALHNVFVKLKSGR